MQLLKMLCGFAAVFVLSLPACADEAVPTGKLPDEATPLSYTLDLTIDPHTDHFSGHTRIRIKLAKSADHVWLHARDIEVSKVEVKDAAGKIHAAKFAQRDPFGVALVSFDAALPAQTVELDFDYSAPFNKQQGQGLYQVKLDADRYAVTQMESTYARFMFPGFDEPRFKTPFDVTLTVPTDDKAFANSRQTGEKPSADKKWKTLTFAQTKPLPTYLIAIAVGPWDVNEPAPIPANAVRKTPLPLRAIGPRGSAAQLKWILGETPGIVQFFEEYTQQPYPYDKLDLLATPSSFGGAMENAGLIVFAGQLLRLDQNSSVGAIRSSFNVTAHEVAHQWFGDLVTVPWWDDIWLNEAFATWAQQKETQALKPQYLGGPARVEASLGAMGGDSLLSARKIRQPITGKGDIENAFDGITYQKGAAVLRMFEEWLGEETYRKAMREYLTAHKFGSGNSDDLIATIAKVSGKGEILKKAMRSFLDQPGIPLVHAEQTCKAGKATLMLSQSRYLPYGTMSPENLQWQVPVCVRLGRGNATSKQCFLLDQPKREFAIEGGCADWLLPNADAAGYYRFTLAEHDFAALKTQIDKFDPVEQMIVADAVSSAFDRGDLSPAAVLDFMPAFAGSDLPQVATALAGQFGWIRERLADDITRPALDAFVAKLYAPRLATLGYHRRADDSDATTRLRQRIVGLLGLTAKDKSVRAELNAQGRAALGLDGSGKVDLTRADPDLRAAALTVAVQDSGAPAFNAAFENLKTNHEPEQRQALLGALGATHDAALGERVRQFGLSPDVTLDDMYPLYGGQMGEPENRAAWWQWLQKNFDALRARLPDFVQGSLPFMGAAGSCEHQHADEMRTFFTPRLKDIVGGDRSLAQAVEGIEQCSALREHVGTKALGAWIEAQAAR